MLQLVAFELVIETGTYRGTATEFLRGLTQAPIVTIEVVDSHTRLPLRWEVLEVMSGFEQF